MTVTLTVTDVNGNDTECTFTVTKVDKPLRPSLSGKYANFSAWRKLYGNTAQLHQLSYNRRQLRRAKRDPIPGSRNYRFRRRQYDRNANRNGPQRQRDEVQLHGNKSGSNAADDHLPGYANFSAWRKLHGHTAKLHQLGHHGRQLRRAKRHPVSGSRNHGFRRRQYDGNLDGNGRQRPDERPALSR
jgi:hypothetical protein